MKPVLCSVNISLPRNVTLDNGKKMFTALFKEAQTSPVYLEQLGFRGDGSADLVHHGGPDLAVCVYPVEHFPFWAETTGREVAFGAFGENLSLSGWTETAVHIGDVFQIGEAQVQVTQPRQPCHKLNKVFQFQEMACRVQKTGYSGWYFRVIKPGWVEAGQSVTRIEQGTFSIEAANDLMHKNKKNAEKLRSVLAEPALSDSWRATFKKRLDQLTGSAAPIPKF